jgi:RimJ/RimL family protein N-acetyltransferase
MMTWACAPLLEGEKVCLRALRREDRSELLNIFAHEFDYGFTTHIPGEATIDGWFEQLELERLAGRSYPYSVLDEAGAVRGTTRFMRMRPVHKRLEIGGTIYAPSVQRTGLNTEIKTLLLHYAFESLCCNVVQLRTDWLNQRSRRAIERLGAKLDGVLRGHLVMPDGHIRDRACYSVIASEWPGVRANLRALRNRYPAS